MTNIIRILEILKKHSHMDNPLTSNQIIEYLEENDVYVERKSIYRNINSLIEMGYGIQKIHENNVRGYYLADSVFDLAELKLLIDAISSSHFISDKKTEIIRNKLLSLTNIHDAKKLDRNIRYSLSKSNNESILYNVDEINNAINNKQQIYFKYFDIDVNKHKRYRKDTYSTIPYSLLWSQDKYYCIGYSTKYQNFTHYRVDKMEKITSIDVEHEYIPLDLAQYTHNIFGMYQGDKVHTTLRFNNEIASLVYEQFGQNVFVSSKTDTYFEIIEDINISPVFFGWLFQLGTKVGIISPISLIEEYQTHLQNILNKINMDT